VVQDILGIWFLFLNCFDLLIFLGVDLESVVVFFLRSEVKVILGNVVCEFLVEFITWMIHLKTDHAGELKEFMHL